LAAACGSGGEQLLPILITDFDRNFSHLPMVKRNQAEKTTVSMKISKNELKGKLNESQGGLSG
jgi:hypothetical protein